MKKDDQIYSNEELEIIKNAENGKLKSIAKSKFQEEKVRLQSIADNSFKRKSISIRVFERDIDKIKALALNEGIPYQTFITSMLHKIAEGKIKDVRP